VRVSFIPIPSSGQNYGFVCIRKEKRSQKTPNRMVAIIPRKRKRILK
jgi:hypothetical protein